MTTFLFADNATTTLGSNLSNVGTTLTVSVGDGALFPSPAAGEQFTVTLNDAATGLVYEICYCTSRAGDNLTVLRAQEGTTAVAWLVGDFAFNGPTAGTMDALSQSASSGRTTLSGATNFYVSTTGNDSHDGLTSGTAWLTGQHAINVLQADYDLAGNTATVIFAAGAYNAELVVSSPFTGGGNVVLQGGGVATITLTAAQNDCLQSAAATVYIEGFTLSSTGSESNCLAASAGGNIYHSNCIFGIAGMAHMQSTGGRIEPISNYSITGAAEYHCYSAASGGVIDLSGRTVTLTGTPAFSVAFMDATANGCVLASGTIWSGGGSGPLGAQATLNGVVDTNGAGVPTGFTSTSSTSSGGQYA